MRTKVVADGQQVEIPALCMVRTVGTYVESLTGAWSSGQAEEAQGRQNRPVSRRRDADRTSVGKQASHVSRKAAIVPYIPVP